MKIYELSKMNFYNVKLISIDYDLHNARVEIHIQGNISNQVDIEECSILMEGVSNLQIPNQDIMKITNCIKDIIFTVDNRMNSATIQLMSDDKFIIVYDDIKVSDYSNKFTLSKLYNKRLKDDTSNLAKKCTLLYNTKSIYQYSNEELRLMLSQEIGLEYLVPIAIENIEINMLSEGDLYPGDLLKSILKVESEYWKNNATLKDRLIVAINTQINAINKMVNVFLHQDENIC